MPYPTDLYAPPLGLLTDLYQLTMAFAAFKAGIADREAAFHLTFRKNPFEGGFTLVCGLAAACDYLERYGFSEDDLAYLRTLRGKRGPLFDDPFLDWLRNLRIALDVDAMPEGTVAFPQEPILPVRGTHAHSWVMLHGDERTAFRDFAKAMPDDCVFLVDTYDSLAGVQNAIEEGRALRAAGHELAGIRLDSGDLAWLSREARRMLDEAGFPDARILASNDLDEHVIASLLREQAAEIDSFGVGTLLVAGRPDAALGGVYKLSAVREGDAWTPRLKLSEQQAKISTPGVLAVRRYRG